MNMIGSIARKIFGSANDRYVKRQYKIVEKINSLEPEISALSDEQLRAKTDEFKKRLSQGETLDELLPEAFAVVRESFFVRGSLRSLIVHSFTA